MEQHLLLDVDGTLIAPARPDMHPPAGMQSVELWEPPLAQSFQAWFRPAAVEAIHRWIAAGVKVHWLTAWSHAAPTLVAPALGLPDLPVFSRPADYSPGRPWKTFSILNELNRLQREEPESEPIKLAWVDDDPRIDDAVVAYWIREHQHLAEMLLVVPNRHRGIDDRQLAEVSEFLGVKTQG